MFAAVEKWKRKRKKRRRRRDDDDDEEEESTAATTIPDFEIWLEPEAPPPPPPPPPAAATIVSQSWLFDNLPLSPLSNTTYSTQNTTSSITHLLPGTQILQLSAT
ncbi:unnamed protein product [Fusarium graminearum]|nr:unnamed protein product [Fusarium graminearum]CAG1996359.1 unnamed protein product [Fusarium graminearum]VTO84151.1 unnamed protein product [Fusarium graminearum]